MTEKLRAAAQQALAQLLDDRNALYECHSVPGQMGVSVDDDAVPALLRYDAIITALSAALTEQQKRTVTYVCPVCAASLERQE